MGKEDAILLSDFLATPVEVSATAPYLYRTFVNSALGQPRPIPYVRVLDHGCT